MNKPSYRNPAENQKTNRSAALTNSERDDNDGEIYSTALSL